MTCYGWERGTLVLPTAAVAPLKKTLRDWANQFYADVYEQAKTIHRDAHTTSVKKYDEYLTGLSRKDHEAQNRERGYFYTTPSPEALRKQFARRTAIGILRDKASRGKIAAPTIADLTQAGLRKYTNKDNTFTVIGQHGYPAAGISFDGREVAWSVDQNNHAVDDAHEAVMTGVFFAALNKINWTRGTGGVITGNDEHNRDSYGAGDGSNYVTGAYGPLGETPQRKYRPYR